MPPRAVVVTVSDRSARGERPDSSGPIAVEALRLAGYTCDDAVVIPDGEQSVAQTLRALVTEGVDLVVTTGGTGVSPRDETPEGTASVLEREIPGIAEELRRRGVAEKPAAMLSRGRAGVAGSTMIVNLPGSSAAVRSGMPVVLSVASHVSDQLRGGDH
ncbi:molybdenum cofactor biosynthesis protein B [Microbacterium sp. C7(2022)]|uniref:MogA/MoaB family molybdenum cofactor biosynthesis protein n=1 Tax=Microbacterium sp. C7(2022) TaxID=2992759 RepID=UPI00237B1E24|nr:MogA/MoaB family molybdenum cofactor biosynthesis protein [Microbacterium sp. C7(2022)]MDE0546074.1 MogA/MoaB family molybdenum cofactor biosynthesis protein [Microbacterium sp. C7(2022)]